MVFRPGEKKLSLSNSSVQDFFIKQPESHPEKNEERIFWKYIQSSCWLPHIAPRRLYIDAEEITCYVLCNWIWHFVRANMKTLQIIDELSKTQVFVDTGLINWLLDMWFLLEDSDEPNGASIETYEINSLAVTLGSSGGPSNDPVPGDGKSKVRRKNSLSSLISVGSASAPNTLASKARPCRKSQMSSSPPGPPTFTQRRPFRLPMLDDTTSGLPYVHTQPVNPLYT